MAISVNSGKKSVKKCPKQFPNVRTILGLLGQNAGLPRSGKKFWKMKKIPGQGITFSVREILKKEKSHGKVREFQNFPKKMLVNRLLEILSFHNLQAILEKECF